MNTYRTVVIFGANGAIGQAFVEHYVSKEECVRCYACVRNEDRLNLSESCLQNPSLKIIEWSTEHTDWVQEIQNDVSALGYGIDCCINAVGALSNDEIQPEKQLASCSIDNLRWSVSQNVEPALCILKEISPLLSKDQLSVMAHITAKVGSITDNGLGGWYSYRGSKAMMNMLIKTTAIEQSRRNKQAVVIALHPGTVDSELSKPFSKNVKPEKLFTPQQSVAYLSDILDSLVPEDTGSFISWSKERLPW